MELLLKDKFGFMTPFFALLNFYNIMFSFRFGPHRGNKILGTFYCACILRSRKEFIWFYMCYTRNEDDTEEEKEWENEKGASKFRKYIFAHQLAIFCSSSCQDEKRRIAQWEERVFESPTNHKNHISELLILDYF